MKRLLASVFLALFPLALGVAEVPVRTEQVVWSILAFNGREYSPTFAPESSDTISLLAGVDNFLSARQTFVYWWPITSEWKTDTDSLNVQLPGTIELRDGRGTVRQLALEQYTYFNVKGEYEVNWKVATGEAARRELRNSAALNASYFKAVQEFQAKSAARDAELQALSARIRQLKDRREDYTALLQKMTALPAPVAPAAPGYYLVPPAEMQQAFILNLSAGLYSLRLLDPDGAVVEGSEKTVLVHDRRRTGGIGFEVIPADKWTRPEESVTPAATLYVSGSADLYLRPFFEDEFNDFAYEKTVTNGAKGNPNISKWVRIQQVPRAAIRVEVPGRAASTISEQPFFVQQSSGSSLGYTIVPWEPHGPFGDKQPNLIAFGVPLRDGGKAIRISATDSTGRRLPGSDRQIRVVGPLPNAGILIAIALAPLLAMVLVLVLRARAYAAGQNREI
jgi:hypothetical protein